MQKSNNRKILSTEKDETRDAKRLSVNEIEKKAEAEAEKTWRESLMSYAENSHYWKLKHLGLASQFPFEMLGMCDIHEISFKEASY